MSDLNPIISQAAAKNGVPEPLLRAVLQTESGIDPNMGDSRIAPAVGTERATGIAQIKPSTARGLGVDPRNPASAIGGAAKYLAQGYSQYGNWDDAARFYHGGPNQKLWGARTEDYHAKITRAAAQAPQVAAPAAAPSDNPFTAALTGPSAAPAQPLNTADNPFTAALKGDGAASYADSANVGGQPAYPVGGNDGAGSRPNVMGRPYGQDQTGAGGGPQGIPQGGGRGQAPQISLAEAAVRGVDNGFLGGFGDKVTAGINAVLPIDALTGRPVESIWNGRGFDKAYSHNLELERATSDAAYAQHPGFELGGELAGVLANPLSKLGAPVEGASSLYNMGRLGAAGGAFGAVHGAGESRAQDLTGVARDAALGGAAGAVFAPALGAVGEKAVIPALQGAGRLLAPAVGKLAETGIGQKAAELAQALSQRSAPRAAEDASAAPDIFAPKAIKTGAQVDTADAVAAMVKDGTPDAEIRAFVASNPGAANVDAVLKYRAQHGSYAPDVIGGKSSAAPADIATARGSRGTRTGIEANANVPAPVASHIADLQAQGVPLDHALREAEISYVGGNPTAADVTRDRVLMQQTKEGAKLNTPEGQALAQQHAENNAAVIGKTVETVNGYGGAQPAGAAMERAANTLAAARDAAKGNVSDLYARADAEAATGKASSDTANAGAQAQANALRAAEAQAQARTALDAAQADLKAARTTTGGNVDKARAKVEGARDALRQATNSPPPAAAVSRGSDGGYINLSKLRDALSAPEMRNPTVDGVATLRNGISGLLDDYKAAGDLYTAKQAESIRQAVNDAYDPMGSAINSKVGSLKDIIDRSLDTASAGPAFRAARTAHQEYASQYEDPIGVAKLIKRDAKGNFLNADNWRATDGLITKTSDKEFVQIAGQLKAIGADDALKQLKAHIVQNAYEAATGSGAGNAVDQLGNSPMSGKTFHKQLNAIGQHKLEAIFTPDEIAHLSTLGHAASHINEAVPGTVNGSNTTSSGANLAAALKKANDAAARQGKTAGGAALAGTVSGIIGGVASHSLEGGALSAAAGIAGKAAEPFLAKRAAGKTSEELAKALKTVASPVATRKAEADALKHLADLRVRQTQAHRYSVGASGPGERRVRQGIR